MNNINKIMKDKINIEVNNFHYLDNGLSNDSYLVNNHYIIRFRGKYVDMFNKPEEEYKIIQSIKPFKFSENVLYYDINIGLKISEYIKNSTILSDLPSDTDLFLIIKAIKKLHKCNANNIAEFSPFQRFDYYKANSSELVNEKFEKEIIKEIKKYYYKQEHILSHNDLVRGNILIKNNNAYLIDWEFGGKNHPYFDIASFLSENKITDSIIITKFLKRFFGKKLTKLIYKRVIYMIMYQNILWYYWAQMRYSKTHDSRFIEIINDKKTMIDYSEEIYHSLNNNLRKTNL